MSLQAFPSGMRFLICSITTIDSINAGRCVYILSVTLRMSKLCHYLDHHKCLRAVSDLTVSH